MKRLYLIGFAMLLSSALLVGCNTIEGAGRDIAVAGEEIQEVADDARD